MKTNGVIEIINVSVAYDHQLVLDRISYTLEAGEFCYLIGKTGAGKSSFLKLLYGDVKPKEGVIHVAGYHVSSMPDREIPHLRRRLGIVFQDFQLLPDRNVFENVAFALRATGQKPGAIKPRVLEVLGQVGLGHKRLAMPNDLSGGEQQRVVIARALVNEPKLLLADEPTGNLDPEVSSSIMELLKQINKRGTAILMVTHNYDIVKNFPFRTVQIKDGQLKDIDVF